MSNRDRRHTHHSCTDVSLTPLLTPVVTGPLSSPFPHSTLIRRKIFISTVLTTTLYPYASPFSSDVGPQKTPVSHSSRRLYPHDPSTLIKSQPPSSLRVAGDPTYLCSTAITSHTSTPTYDKRPRDNYASNHVTGRRFRHGLTDNLYV